jgi:arylsulfatase
MIRRAARRVVATSVVALVVAAGAPVMAQASGAQASGAQASGEVVLPVPPAPFAGTIGETYADSVASFPKPVTAPAGAPNVLLVLTDDVGFGAASTFGGPVPTPNLDRLAARGLLYNRFHTTAMCSPTRAALLTGRNHHAVNNGIVANLSTGFPGYDNLLPRSAATIAEVLRQNGYNTAMFGKHHNTPEPHVSPAGPFDLWPTGLGFEYFYGFMAADANQFRPALYRNTSRIPTLKEGVLDKAMADEAIHWIHEQKAAAPDKPFFVYYAPGSTHNPLQAPADWIAKFRGQFDAGWDAVREQTVERQRRAGIVPKATVNTGRPSEIPAWKTLSPDEKRVNARLMEVYAAMLAYQDAQIGRLLDELDRMGESKRTLVMFIEGDNGAAPEAGLHGGSNPMGTFANGFTEDVAMLAANLDKLGGPDSFGGFGYGWAWAMNAPFPWFKQYASHLGGTRNGFVVSWPEQIAGRGLRSQFVDLTDVVPTILELTRVKAPDVVNGTRQQPIDGVSFAYTFDAPQAPERHRTQYFEMMGNRALYSDGWMLSTTPQNRLGRKPDPSVLPTDYKWELYDLRSDFSQSRDLAAREPERVARMKEMFRVEAVRNHVFPLDDRLNLARFQASAALLPQRTHYTYWGGDISLPTAAAAPLFNRGFRLAADIDVGAGSGATGPLLAIGGNFAGWSFYLKNGVPAAMVATSQREIDQFKVVAGQALPAGKTRLTFDFAYDGKINGGGELVISANGREIGRGRVARTISKVVDMTDTFDIGMDADQPVTLDYPVDSRFPGTIERVDIDLGAPGAPGLPSAGRP